LKAFAPEAERTTSNSNETIRIVTAKGNVIVFPKNSFTLNGTPVAGNVEIDITEITTKSEMIFSDLMTNSEEGPLDSRGEFIVKAFQNGAELQLADDVDFTIENPNGVNSLGMKIFMYQEHPLRGFLGASRA
jgi:hypothetical protein